MFLPFILSIMNEVNDQTYIDESRKYKIIRIKALDKCTARHFVYLILAAILACIVIAVYVNTDTEHNKINKILPDSLELMSPIDDRSIEIFAFGAGLFLSATVSAGAGYVAKVTFTGGSVFGGISGRGPFIASIAIFLISGSIAAGLVGSAVETVTSGPRTFEMS